MEQEANYIPSQETEQSEPRYYFNAASLIDDFESSDSFRKAVEDRTVTLHNAHPGLQIRPQDVELTMRGSDEYIRALHDFYHEGHYLPLKDSEKYKNLSEEVQRAIQEYWNYIDYVDRRLPVLRAEYQEDREMLYQETLQLERQRDKRHVAAALALLGDGLKPLTQEDVDDWPTGEEIKIGRQLVSLLTEQRGLDRADPDREKKKLFRRIYNDQQIDKLNTQF